MAEILINELAHIDLANINGRILPLIPMWTGSEWRGWSPTTPGKVIEMKMVDAVHSDYLAKQPARRDDIHIPLVDFLWQRASWPKVMREATAMADDLHLLATFAAKLDHFHGARETIEPDILSSFVKTEIENALVVARSIFDLFQAAVSHIWTERFTLIDPAAEALRRRHKLPREFSRVVLANEKPRSADELAAAYGFPQIMAEAYAKHALFFASLRSSRDSVVHHGSTVDHIYVTERGFAVSPDSRHYADFPWTTEHHYNEPLVSLMPWVARLVFKPIEACSEVMGGLASVLPFPPKIAPDYHVYIRDPANKALLRLLEAAEGKRVWWGEEADAENSTAA